MIITTDAVMGTDPCPDYPRERIKAIVGDGLDPSDPATLEVVVLALLPGEARRVLSRLMTQANALTWARGCAERARRYVAAQSAAATQSAANACDAATYYAAAAATHYAANACDAATYYAAATYTHYAVNVCTAYAAYAANAAGAAAIEHRQACRHALELIATQPRKE